MQLKKTLVCVKLSRMVSHRTTLRKRFISAGSLGMLVLYVAVEGYACVQLFLGKFGGCLMQRVLLSKSSLNYLKLTKRSRRGV